LVFYLLIFHNKENGYGKENFFKANYDVNSLYCLLKNACPTPRGTLRRFAALPSLPTKKPPVGTWQDGGSAAYLSAKRFALGAKLPLCGNLPYAAQRAAPFRGFAIPA
jgi:hypothetical protein